MGRPTRRRLLSMTPTSMNPNPADIPGRAARYSIAIGAACVIGFVLVALVSAGRETGAAEPKPDPRARRLTERLKQSDFEERRRAADALGDIGPAAAAAVPELVESLKDEHVEVHWYALDALGRIGQAATIAVPALSDALTNPRTNRYSRRVAARALGRFGPLAADAVAALTKDLDAEDRELRVEAALALWRVSAEPRAIDALIRLIEGGNNEKGSDSAAFSACLALSEIGPSARPSVPTLLAALAGPDADIRRAAARALGAIGPDALEPLATKLAERPPALDPDARASAMDAIAAIAEGIRRSTFDRASASAQQTAAAAAPFNERVIPALAEQLNSADPVASRHAARALAAVGLLALPVLAEALLSDRPPVRQAADGALDALQQALADGSESRDRFRPQLRSAATALNRALAGNRAAKQAAARAFALLPLPGSAETVDLLRKVITTDDLATRHYAAQALTQFENQEHKR
jgi:HEAT repeat protein